MENLVIIASICCIRSENISTQKSYKGPLFCQSTSECGWPVPIHLDLLCSQAYNLFVKNFRLLWRNVMSYWYKTNGTVKTGETTQSAA